MLLAQLLWDLPERDRELIRMRYFQNKTQTEIAGILGISQVQVSRLRRVGPYDMAEAQNPIYIITCTKEA